MSPRGDASAETRRQIADTKAAMLLSSLLPFAFRRLFGQFPRTQRAQSPARGTAILGPTWEEGFHDTISKRLLQQVGREIVDINLGSPAPRRRGIAGLSAYGDVREAPHWPFTAHELPKISRTRRDNHRHIERERLVSGDDHVHGVTLLVLQ
jgi:hypothetical protein